MISRNYDFPPEDQVSEAPGTRRCGIVFTASCLPSLDVTIDPFLPVVSVFFFACGGLALVVLAVIRNACDFARCGNASFSSLEQQKDLCFTATAVSSSQSAVADVWAKALRGSLVIRARCRMACVLLVFSSERMKDFRHVQLWALHVGRGCVGLALPLSQ